MAGVQHPILICFPRNLSHMTPGGICTQRRGWKNPQASIAVFNFFHTCFEKKKLREEKEILKNKRNERLI